MRSLALLLFLVVQASNVSLRIIAVRTADQAREVRARIQKGDSFEELARKYSSDPSASGGGYLGTFALSDLRKEFQDDLAGLHPGDLCTVLAVNGDYVLLQLLKPEESKWKEQMD